jgi:fructose/tagatose bisphosphate aldolase
LIFITLDRKNNMALNEINIESTEEALALFEEFEGKHSDAFVEKTSSADGLKLITLAIENLPAVLAAVTALIAVLKKREIKFKLTKDGAEVSSLEDAKTADGK